MRQDDHEASELIRSGSYFAQSRDWYKALYIGPISERSFFLLVAMMAALIAVIGFFAFIGLLPINERPPILIPNARMDATVPAAVALRQGDMSVNDTLRRFHITQYVSSREGYAATDFVKNSLYVTAHSDAATNATYVAAVGPSNPRNPAALLGANGKRTVQILAVAVNDKTEPQTATVRFTTELGGSIAPSKTQWTATMQFYYSDAVVTDVTDPETDEETPLVQEPTFQVVNYAVSQN